MEAFGYLFRGVLIGMIFGLPAGAVGAMTIQRTYSHGVKAGLLTGLGSSVADCLYAAIGACGLTLISDFLLMYQTAIRLVGGALVVGLGVRLMRRGREAAPSALPQAKNCVSMFLSSFVVGITNPAAVLTFLFAFSALGIVGSLPLVSALLLVIGVFIGTYLWWGALSGGVALIKKKAGQSLLPRLNVVCGVGLIAFGVIVFWQTFFK